MHKYNTNTRWIKHKTISNTNTLWMNMKQLIAIFISEYTACRSD